MIMRKQLINTFDIDGVIYFGEDVTGVRPGRDDVIITGRSYQQELETISMLKSREIHNHVMFNPLKRTDDSYSRRASGIHKAKCITKLMESYKIGLHFEDDPIQIDEIKKVHPELNVIHLVREGLIGY
jgi:hypothetical protein|tara:strand:- start:670 stop:1053 length:384 start_codon:yes stop_codon:yes gene_type:complete